MTEASFASLSPTLLARKGGAKPAMRPQLAPLDAAANSANLEDLGWNDMGENDDSPVAADIVPLTPAPANPEAEQQAREDDREADAILAQKTVAASPRRDAREQLREVERRLDEKTPQVRQRRPATQQGRRAAFTLRLDPKRHLKLKLASTIRNRSAQQLVTEALDNLLDDMPDLDGLAAQVKRP